jgi:hypothetical protein
VQGAISHQPFPEDLNNAQAESVADESDRENALLKILSMQPAVRIQGPADCGKTSFIIQLKEKYKTVFSENEIEAWANTQGISTQLSFLVIRLRKGNWGRFVGLYSWTPQLLINGKIYDIADTQKVIFIGDNDSNDIFLQQVSILTFQPFSAAYIAKNIVKPIFETCMNDEANIDASLQAFMQRNVDKLYPIHSLKTRAVEYCLPIPKDKMAKVHSRDYIITPTREPIADRVKQCTSIRRYLPQALWIEGPAGIGKTELIRHVLPQAQIITADTEPDLLMQKLRRAFSDNNHPPIVVDELDTLMTNLPEIYIQEIRGYLKGHSPDFTRHPSRLFLLATGNGISFAGRKTLPFLELMHCFSLNQYTHEECTAICNKIPHDPNIDAEKLIQQYLINPKKFTFRQLIATMMTPASTTRPVLWMADGDPGPSSRKRRLEEDNEPKHKRYHQS